MHIKSINICWMNNVTFDFWFLFFALNAIFMLYLVPRANSKEVAHFSLFHVWVWMCVCVLKLSSVILLSALNENRQTSYSLPFLSVFWVLHFRFNKLITSVEVIVADCCTFLQQIPLTSRMAILWLDVNHSHSHETKQNNNKINIFSTFMVEFHTCIRRKE